MKRAYHCSSCKSEGHNVRTCSAGLDHRGERCVLEVTRSGRELVCTLNRSHRIRLAGRVGSSGAVIRRLRDAGITVAEGTEA